MLPAAAEYGMGVITWSPLAGGLLSGKYRTSADTPSSRRADRVPDRYDRSDPANEAKFAAADALGALADETGISLIQMAIAFVLAHPAVTAPIIGPRTMEDMQSQLAALDVTLSDDVLDRIDEIGSARNHVPSLRRGRHRRRWRTRRKGGAANREVRTGKPRPVRVLGHVETCAGHAGIQVTAELYGRYGRHAAAQIDRNVANLPVAYS